MGKSRTETKELKENIKENEVKRRQILSI